MPELMRRCTDSVLRVCVSEIKNNFVLFLLFSVVVVEVYHLLFVGCVFTNSCRSLKRPGGKATIPKYQNVHTHTVQHIFTCSNKLQPVTRGSYHLFFILIIFIVSAF